MHDGIIKSRKNQLLRDAQTSREQGFGKIAVRLECCAEHRTHDGQYFFVVAVFVRPLKRRIVFIDSGLNWAHNW